MSNTPINKILDNQDKGYHAGIRNFNNWREENGWPALALKGNRLAGHQLWYSIEDGPITGIDFRNVDISKLDLTACNINEGKFDSREQVEIARGQGAKLVDPMIDPLPMTQIDRIHGTRQPAVGNAIQAILNAGAGGRSEGARHKF